MVIVECILVGVRICGLSWSALFIVLVILITLKLIGFLCKLSFFNLIAFITPYFIFLSNHTYWHFFLYRVHILSIFHPFLNWHWTLWFYHIINLPSYSHLSPQWLSILLLIFLFFLLKLYKLCFTSLFLNFQ